MDAVVEDARLDEDGRGRADRAEKPPLLGLAAEAAEQEVGVLEVLRALAAARQDDRVEVAVRDGRERRVGLHRDAVGARDVEGVGKGGRDDLDAAAPEDVDDRDGLDLLKSLREGN